MGITTTNIYGLQIFKSDVTPDEIIEFANKYGRQRAIQTVKNTYNEETAETLVQLLIKYAPARGGRRDGAGNKPLPYKSKLIQFKVNPDYAEELKEKIREIIKNYKK